MAERILITGGLGVIGRELLDYLMLQSENHMIFVTDVAPVGPSWMGTVDNNVGHKQVIYVPFDVTCANDAATVFAIAKPTIVYHLAAIYGRLASEQSKEKSFAVNVLGSYTVARLARQWDAKLVHLSSGEVYGKAPQREDAQPDPDNWYGLTKWQGEQVARYTHPQATVLRPFMLYAGTDPFGNHRSALVRFAEQTARGNFIEVHTGAERSWFHLKDAARMIALAARLKGGEVINIGNPEPGWSLDRLANVIADAQGKPLMANIRDVPEKITAVKRPDLTRMVNTFGPPRISMAEGVHTAARIILQRVKDERDFS